MEKKLFISLFISLLLICACNKQAESEKALKNYPIFQDSVPIKKKRSLEELSLREKIGQTMMMKIDIEKELRIGNGSYKEYFNKYPVGGVFMASWIIADYTSKDKIAQFIKDRIMIYNENSKVPMLFQEDYEAGAGDKFDGYERLTSLMGVGAANDTSLAYEYGYSISKQARDLGINWLLHPVADLDLNPLNNLVSTRSASDNPDEVIKIIRSQIKAMKDNNVAATLKHFPGDGVDYRDQHLITTENTLKMEEWWSTYGKIYKSIINEGISSIMLGHIRLNNFQKDKINGYLPPATLSKELVDLLKNKMNYKGVVITDALDMGGYAQYYPTAVESQVASFEAGCDMLLWPDEAYMDSVEAKILRKEIPMSRLNDAVKRVWKLKEKLGILDPNYQYFEPITKEGKVKIKKIANSLAEKSITLVSNKSKIFPLKKVPGKKIRFSIITPKNNINFENKNLMTTVNALREKGFEVDTVLNTFKSGYSDENTSDIYSHYIYAFVRIPFVPISSKILQEHEAMAVWAINKLPQDKVITISFGDPYIHNRYFERVGASVNAYSSNKWSQLALVKAICGDIKFHGESPVEIKNKMNIEGNKNK